MNEQCKHFQSRTYSSGEAARYCSLDLAPEAPWKCPDACPSFAPRLADVGWSHGSLIPEPVEPPPAVDTADLIEVLESAGEIVAEASRTIAAETPLSKRTKGGWRFWKRDE